ncbi:NEDD8 activating enzyme [Dispira simplex]|nr:NEDD8 activating enzyme [Dispira simplex]
MIEQVKYAQLYQCLELTTIPSGSDFTSVDVTNDTTTLVDPAEQDQAREFLHVCKVLVVGAGGLGCEILKNLALSGFTNIHVIDMDTIDLSNLNRQFLFRTKDIGQPKATVAAEFLQRRLHGIKVTPHFNRIEDKDDAFYRQFDLIVCGLDSVEARRWINALVIRLNESGTVLPLIDGGSEGLGGQARVILPPHTSCYECSLDLLKKQTVYPLCTIANTPRLPEHCIEWASVVGWPEHAPGEPLDTDNPDHLRWLYQTALDRARQFGIPGVTYSLTQGVVKNIVPALAYTNAIIAGACVNEALKLVTCCQPTLDNYMMYTGSDGIYTYTYKYEKRPDCPVCGREAKVMSVHPNTTLEKFLEILSDTPDIQLQNPSVGVGSRSLYMQSPPPLEAATRPNLEKPLCALVDNGDEMVVTAKALPISLLIRIKFITDSSESSQ